MDGAFVGGRGEGQADGVAAGSKPLVRLGLKAAKLKLPTAAGITRTSEASCIAIHHYPMLRRLSLGLLASAISLAAFQTKWRKAPSKSH